MTETLKHTPGPWRWQKTRSGQNYQNLWSGAEGEFDPVVSADEYAGSAWMEISSADAAVIEAAPDLLEALKHARSQIQHPDQMIDEAIAKAEGRDA